MAKAFYRLLTELSSHAAISRMAGAFARSGLSRRLIPRFAKVYGIPIEEAEKTIDQYESLNAFFTRKLKPGLRPIDPDPNALVSPVDALITGMGPISDGTVLNVKGQHYTVGELLNRSPRMIHYRNGFCYVLYLSPSDYHRIHAPLSGKVEETEAIPGRVYPVNDFGLRYMNRVLSRNVRTVTYIRGSKGETAVIKVGAFNVSSIRYVQDAAPQSVERGEELAYFEFGSTVVLLIENGTFVPEPDLKVGDKVRVGQSLGILRAKTNSRKEG
ncbi:phosphatidylserine decarboxylase [Xylanibacillus composti]|uniref:Phosphatidylserine decarboxylase proenzyme n=1 Tax=Xylanibacillus composti TaxID=1572762 RepID=A0A8J4H2Y0_9BACL|nr:archaetidylserine decarboxylase [Xylanibacillus composti]MDT9723476.1 phosphatidylserine decarboxylase [Xylanibacillus composti]GIQ68487.1 phosphatidylserine decarboxylase proenzyme [Xylanibacillus composti]